MKPLVDLADEALRTESQREGRGKQWLARAREALDRDTLGPGVGAGKERVLVKAVRAACAAADKADG